MHIQKTMLLTSVCLVFIVSLPANVIAAPPPPCVFWGVVKLSGANVPMGTTVTAFVYDSDGQTPIICGAAPTQTYGEDSVYAVNANGDDDAVGGKSGAQEGDVVHFWIGDGPSRVLAPETGVWRSAASVRVDLSASGSVAPGLRTYLPMILRLG